MSYPVIPKIECAECNETYGRFVAEPVDKGFGATLGNSLRRVLLGYLPGAAITRVKIEGVQHEFSTIPHVKEDVTEFMLNVKGIRMKALTGRPAKLTLEVEGEGRVTAGDIKPSTDCEIINPERHLATLDSAEAKLYAEFDVEVGTGYREATSSANLPVDTIPIDSVFTPMRKVNFSIEPTHIGQETSRERVILEIWTDGTLSPVNALSQSAEILLAQITPFVDYAKVSQIEMEKKAIRMTIPEEVYNMPVEKLDLSVRTLNCLRRADINSVGELVSREEKGLLRLRNFGQKSLQEIKEKLTTMGLSLAAEPKETQEEVEEPKTKSARGRKKKAEVEEEAEEGAEAASES